ncbi:hypothetical protein ASG37_04995 [Sphingomonas sp. Leaf407]|uniref:hypothetical protein n=1 Tax=unclassified Sphingomonas TaxID=196159 RepID=UPI0006FE4F2C|nr:MULTISPECIES: hypothetical protein [unclassified Sphingomonas]KQN37019.1 hypothetical protein ASE97_10910 [Sphingomonas sp. Leaf42]KQT30446.1 hypothetical protein ASG37_04995 [Sphingomonas sp. Leaf407]
MADTVPLLDALERLSDDLDRTIARGRTATPSQGLYEVLADEARGIARRLDEAARGKCRTPSNPPRYVSPDGSKAAW